jgi:hypothetical protein
MMKLHLIMKISLIKWPWVTNFYTRTTISFLILAGRLIHLAILKHKLNCLLKWDSTLNFLQELITEIKKKGWMNLLWKCFGNLKTRKETKQICSQCYSTIIMNGQQVFALMICVIINMSLWLLKTLVMISMCSTWTPEWKTGTIISLKCVHIIRPRTYFTQWELILLFKMLIRISRIWIKLSNILTKIIQRWCYKLTTQLLANTLKLLIVTPRIILLGQKMNMTFTHMLMISIHIGLVISQVDPFLKV